MKKNFINAFFLMAAFTAQDVFAQDSVRVEKKVIVHSFGSDAPTTVVVSGDSVWVNGEPQNTDGKNDGTIKKQVVVRKFGNGQPVGKVTVLGVLFDKNDKGVEVKSVVEKSPAEKAGLKKGDIITAVDDLPMAEPKNLSNYIRSKNGGDAVKVDFLRNGKKQKTTATLVENEDPGFGNIEETLKALSFDDMPFDDFKFDMPNNMFGDMQFGDRPKLGLTLRDVEGKDGVEVIEVAKDGLGDKAGFQKGDIITKIDDVKIGNTDKATITLKVVSLKKSFDVEVLRNNKTETLKVVYPKKIKTVEL